MPAVMRCDSVPSPSGGWRRSPPIRSSRPSSWCQQPSTSTYFTGTGFSLFGRYRRGPVALGAFGDSLDARIRGGWLSAGRCPVQSFPGCGATQGHGRCAPHRSFHMAAGVESIVCGRLVPAVHTRLRAHPVFSKPRVLFGPRHPHHRHRRIRLGEDPNRPADAAARVIRKTGHAEGSIPMCSRRCIAAGEAQNFSASRYASCACRAS